MISKAMISHQCCFLLLFHVYLRVAAFPSGPMFGRRQTRQLQLRVLSRSQTPEAAKERIDEILYSSHFVLASSIMKSVLEGNERSTSDDESHDAINDVLPGATYRAKSPLLVRHPDGFVSHDEGPFISMFDFLYLSQFLATSTDEGVDFAVGMKKRKKQNFKLLLAYNGTAFCGWQTQSPAQPPSIQQTIEDCLVPINNGERVDVRVCGRTDAGVHAIGQIGRFRTWNKTLNSDHVFHHLQKHLPTTSIRCLQVLPASTKFHPSFGCTARSYAYLIDEQSWNITPLELTKLNSILVELENKELDFIGVSYGPVKTEHTLCTLYHARAVRVSLDSGANEYRGICIELVGNRFLRRMVRRLVATAVQLVVESSESSFQNDALLRLLAEKKREVCAKSAPAEGLVFVQANFNATNP